MQNHLELETNYSRYYLRSLVARLLEVWYYVTAAVVLFILARGATNHFDHGLPFLPALLFGCGWAVHSYWQRRVIRYYAIDGFPPREIDKRITFISALLLVALSLRASALETVALWLPYIAMELHWWIARQESLTADGRTSNSAPATTPFYFSRRQPIAARENGELAADHDTAVLQQLRRIRVSGGEQMVGSIRLEFAPDQEIAVAHVAFCPALPCLPQVSLRATHGETVQLKVTDCFAHGMRVEAKRRSLITQTQEVIVEWQAHAVPVAR